MEKTQEQVSKRRRPTRKQKTRRTMITLLVAAAVAVLSLGSLAASLFARDTSSEPVQEQTANPEASVDQAQPEDATQEEQANEPSERDVYVATWAERIDTYNAGTPLAGYGETFAQAAYDNGVDPRYAPAIARVESGSGSVCAYSCNAWGWGSYSWPDWGTAIWDYTAQLKASYGHTLSYDAAYVYNEENPDGWYEEVANGMYAIWPEESL